MLPRLVLLACCVSISALPAQMQLVPSEHAIPDVYRGVSAYDAHRDVVVLMDSLDAGLWEWDGTAWTRRQELAAAPPFVGFGAMTYDAVRRVCLLVTFGGTFEWDGARWTDRTPGGGPSSRNSVAMAYDPVRDRTVLFGGGSGSTQFDDTWEWNGAAGTWTSIQTVGRPPGRERHTMFWDASRRTLVMYGGIGPLWLGDTWEYDGSTATWTRITTPGPTPRANHAAAYDVSRGRGLLVGGSNLGSALDDTWEWVSSSGSWLRVGPADPGAREGAVMSYDSARRRVILFGGVFDPAPQAQETWGHAAGTWRRLADNGTPPFGGIWGRASTFDWSRGVVVRIANRPGTDTVEVWEWDGATWTRRRPPTSPDLGESANATVSATYDPRTGRVLTLITTWSSSIGFGIETWEWDGLAEAWRQLQPATSPPVRNAHALAYDLAGDQVMMFGGSSFQGLFDDTWVWDRSVPTWRRLTPGTSPPARYNAALATDAARQRVVLFGGATSTTRALRDTWEWTGSDWVQASPTVVPEGSERPSLTYDVARDRVVLARGSAHLFPNPTDFWDWDGRDWTPRGPILQMPIGYSDVTHDPWRRRTVVFSSRSRTSTRLYGPRFAAEHVAFGSGCPGSVGTPRLGSEPFDQPWIGDTFRMSIDNVPAGANVAMLLGRSDTTWQALTLPLSLGVLGMPGCTLFTSVDVALPVTTVVGPNQRRWSIRIPADANLIGARVFQQVLSIDGGAANGIGAVSNAATIRFGAR